MSGRRRATAPPPAERDQLAAIGIAAGLVATLLFGILYWVTGEVPAVVAGSGGGLLLLAASLAAASANRKDGKAPCTRRSGRG